MTQLPEKFSAGIRLAVADMKKCAKSSKYKINMEVWHFPYVYQMGIKNKAICAVCMGGAVMAQTLKVPFKSMVNPPDINPDVSQKIVAFDFFRAGNVSRAVAFYTGKTLSFEFADEVMKRDDYVEYEESPKKFYAWALAVADELEKKGY